MDHTLMTPDRLLEPFAGEGQMVSFPVIVRHWYGTENRYGLRLRRYLGPTARSSATGVFATKNTASGSPRVLRKNPATCAPITRWCALSKKGCGFVIGRVKRERAKSQV